MDCRISRSDWYGVKNTPVRNLRTNANGTSWFVTGIQDGMQEFEPWHQCGSCWYESCWSEWDQRNDLRNEGAEKVEPEVGYATEEDKEADDEEDEDYEEAEEEDEDYEEGEGEEEEEEGDEEDEEDEGEDEREDESEEEETEEGEEEEEGGEEDEGEEEEEEETDGEEDGEEDVKEDVERCQACEWEMEGGGDCGHCGWPWTVSNEHVEQTEMLEQEEEELDQKRKVHCIDNPATPVAPCSHVALTQHCP